MGGAGAPHLTLIQKRPPFVRWVRALHLTLIPLRLHLWGGLGAPHLTLILTRLHLRGGLRASNLSLTTPGATTSFIQGPLGHTWSFLKKNLRMRHTLERRNRIYCSPLCMLMRMSDPQPKAHPMSNGLVAGTLFISWHSYGARIKQTHIKKP